MLRGLILSLCLLYPSIKSWSSSIDSLYTTISKENDFQKIEKILPNYLAIANANEIGDIYFLVGWKCGKTNRVKEAFDYYNLSRKSYKKAGNLEQQQMILENLGSLAIKQNLYDIAEKYYLQALALNQKIGDKKQIALSTRDIGYVKSKQQKKGDAVQYFKDAAKVFVDIEEFELASETYMDLGAIFKELESYSKARDYYYTAQRYSPDSERIQAMAMNNLAELDRLRGEFNEAIFKLDSAIKLKKKLGDDYFMVTSLNNLGIIHYQQKNYEKAFESFHKSFQKTMDNGVEQYTYHNLSISYSYMDSIALIQGDKYRLVDLGIDRAFRSMEVGLIKDLEDYKKKDMRFQAEMVVEREHLEEQRIANIWLVIGSVLVLIATLAVGLYFYLRERERRLALKALQSAKVTESAD